MHEDSKHLTWGNFLTHVRRFGNLTTCVRNFGWRTWTVWRCSFDVNDRRPYRMTTEPVWQLFCWSPIHTGRARATQINGTCVCEWTPKNLHSNLCARVQCGLGLCKGRNGHFGLIWEKTPVEKQIWEQCFWKFQRLNGFLFYLSFLYQCAARKFYTSGEQWKQWKLKQNKHRPQNVWGELLAIEQWVWMRMQSSRLTGIRSSSRFLRICHFRILLNFLHCWEVELFELGRFELRMYQCWQTIMVLCKNLARNRIVVIFTTISVIPGGSSQRKKGTKNGPAQNNFHQEEGSWEYTSNQQHWQVYSTHLQKLFVVFFCFKVFFQIFAKQKWILCLWMLCGNAYWQNQSSHFIGNKIFEPNMNETSYSEHKNQWEQAECSEQNGVLFLLWEKVSTNKRHNSLTFAQIQDKTINSVTV